MNKLVKRYISLAALLLIGGAAAAQSAPTGVVVNGSVYGGGNLADVTGSASVTVSQPGGTVAESVFGGGKLAKVTGSTTVNVSGGTIQQDVYGGGALADVGTSASDATTVNITGGKVLSAVYGGGLGQKAVADDPATEEVNEAQEAIAAKVYGVVTVNIGTNLSNGTATLNTASVFGGNNANGSPQDDVTVNIYKTYHSDGTGETPNNTVGGTAFAIDQVFGGGNAADYDPAEGKKSTVHVYGCENTIRRSFGGGNAAATPGVVTIIEGGRIGKVFGGGNGEDIAADINGDVDLEIQGGYIGEFYGASNTSGTISGDIHVNVNSTGGCAEGLTIGSMYSGSNEAVLSGTDLVTNIGCTTGDLTIENLYGGCNQANITANEGNGGNVTLNVRGGNYTNVFGGSKGTSGTAANIDGNVTLNLYGGTIENVFGGSDVNGNIYGTITVNVLDEEGSCPLYITNIYGGSNLTSYIPSFTPASGSERISPVVNVVHIQSGISGNVYGGSKGDEDATGEDVTKVKASPLVNIGYDAASMSGLLTGYTQPAGFPRAIIAGSVFGGGDAAQVDGNTVIFLRNKAKVFGNVYGGGNMGEVTGNTKVIVNGVAQ